MATPINGQITDAIAQTGVGVLGNASAMAMGAIYQSSAHSLGIVFQNTVQAQQQAAICAQAATNQGVIQIYSAGTATAARATVRTAKSGSSNSLQDALILMLLMKQLKS